MRIEAGKAWRLFGVSVELDRRRRIFFLLLALLGAGIAMALLLASPSMAVQNGGVWQRVQTASSPGSHIGYSLAVIDNKVYLFGGVDGQGNPTNGLWVYDPVANAWSQVPGDNPPSARAFHAAAVQDGQMVVHGGLDGVDTLGDMWVYDPAAQAWTQKTPPGPTPPALSHHRAVVVDGKMVIVGGADSIGQPNAETWAYDSTASSWTKGADHPGPFGAAYGAAVFAPDSTVMVGGTTGNDYYVYDPATNTWTQKTSANGFPSRTSPGAAQVGDTGYIFGGEDTSTGEYRADVWKADLTQDPVQWEPGPPDMPNCEPELVLVPEMYSPVVSSLAHVYPNVAPEPAVLLYGRSWTYDPASSIPIPIFGDAATFVFWPDRSAAGPLAGLSILPDAAILPTGTQQLFNAYGQDADGYYVPFTPTWGATGGSVTDFGLYTAGDWPGTYYVAVVGSAAASEFRVEAPVTVTGTETCPDLSSGASWSHTFAYTGSYPYHDRASPGNSGTVVVNPALAALNSVNAMWVVSITATGFDPSVVVIGRNDTVRWINDDMATHAVGGGEYRQYHFVYLPLVLR